MTDLLDSINHIFKDELNIELQPYYSDLNSINLYDGFDGTLFQYKNKVNNIFINLYYNYGLYYLIFSINNVYIYKSHETYNLKAIVLQLKEIVKTIFETRKDFYEFGKEVILGIEI